MVEVLRAQRVTDWAPLLGNWEQEPESISYSGFEQNEAFLPNAPRFGYALSAARFANGKVEASVTLPPDPTKGTGQFLLGFSSWDAPCISAGIGGLGGAYLVAQFTPGVGWRRLAWAGTSSNLKGDHPYRVEVRVDGQRISLVVDGIKVLDLILRDILSREQVGLYAEGDGPVRFGQIEVSNQASTAFIVMQFSAQFEDLYEDVIRPVCEEVGIEAYRASDISRPGVILQDILQGLDESSVVIADLTPPNPNVFYELGYSHALRKPVILLAEHDTPLPFDISGYRVIFYDNTIGGKSNLESELRHHLSNIQV